MQEIEKNIKIESKDIRDKIKKATSYAMTFFTIVLLTVFPLYYRDYYYDILVAKYQFFYLTALIMTGIMVLSILYTIVRDYKRFHLMDFFNFNIAQWAMLAFCMIAIISTLQSDFKYESLWGNEGRFSGLFLILLYGSVFFIISKRAYYSKWIIDLFLGASMLLCILGITDYFMLDILNFKENIVESQYNMFASTIGNINTYTAFVAMVMGISAVLFTSAKTLKRCVWYFICMTISFFAIIMGLSDNAYLSLAALFVFLPLWLFKSKTGIKRYMLMCTVFIYVIYIVDFVNKAIPDHVLQMSGILEKISGYSRLEYIVAAASIISVVVYLIDYISKSGDKSYGKKFQILWGGLLITLFLGFSYVLYDANIAGNGQRYGALQNYLVFDDEWGTHRGYIWRIGMESYLKLPMIHKIFGHGPDTFGLMVSIERYDEMISKYNEYFDSAHNEYLQYLFTLGPFGLLSYVMVVIGSGMQIIKKAGKDPYMIGILFAVICYSVQAVVNISLPITTPVFIILIAVGLAGSKTVRAEG